jgi:hypothetical protein
VVDALSESPQAHPRYERLLSLPAVTPYTGEIIPGQFTVCTSLYSPAGVYVYTIEILGALPSDRYVTSVSVSNGECKVVFDTNRRGGPVPAVKVTAGAGYYLLSIDLWDWRSIANGFTPGVGYQSVTFVSEGAYGPTLTGFAGAVTRFQFYPITPHTGATAPLDEDYACPTGGISTQAVCGQGNHGGTGTLQFALD